MAGVGVAAVAMLCGAASAQENLDAGKSGAQLYASNCAICHKSAQALNKSGGGLLGLDSFLREHYTSSRESAATIAAYLKTVGGGPAERRPAGKKARSESKTEKKKAYRPDAKPEGKPEPKDVKPSETKPSDRKPEDNSDKKPDKKEGGATAHPRAAGSATAATRG